MKGPLSLAFGIAAIVLGVIGIVVPDSRLAAAGVVCAGLALVLPAF